MIAGRCTPYHTPGQGVSWPTILVVSPAELTTCPLSRRCVHVIGDRAWAAGWGRRKLPARSAQMFWFFPNGAGWPPRRPAARCRRHRPAGTDQAGRHALRLRNERAAGRRCRDGDTATVIPASAD